MNTAQIFSACSMLALSQWLVLVIIPMSKLNRWLMTYAVIPTLLSIIYCLYIVSFFYLKGGGYGSMEQLRVLFANDNVLLAGWVHYLAFDLLVGFAIVSSAHENKLPRLLIILGLVLTFIFGPAGYLLYRLVKLRKMGSPAGLPV